MSDFMFLQLFVSTNVSFVLAQLADNNNSAVITQAERLVHGLCALLLGECLIYNENLVPQYTSTELERLVNS